MIVYRIEDANNGGPYNGDKRSEVFNALPVLQSPSWDCPDRHPMPRYDIPEWDACIVDRWRYLFGFSSIEQLQQWFNAEERETLSNIGFSIATFEVDACDVMLGGHQVAFNKDKAIACSRLPLTYQSED